MDLKISGFAEADDEEFDPIVIPIPWRSADGEKSGVEEFEAKPRIPTGVLFELESGSDAAMIGLIEAALRSDDGDPDNLLDPTSSLARWRALVNDEDREIPGAAIGEVLRGLFAEYVNRRGPLMGKRRPTKKDGRSSSSSSRSGRSSTGRQRVAASTSDDSPPTED